MKKIISITLVISLMICGLTVSGFAVSVEPGIEPNFVGLIRVSAAIDINDSGRAHCYASAAADPGYHMYLTMDLQRLNNGTWTTIYSWTTNGYDYITLDKYRYVSEGYDYRVVARVVVYNSDGNIVETANAISGTKHYPV